MVRRGRDLELLVEHIEKLLATGTTGKVESPKELTDKTTGQSREHDIVISYPGHHAVVVAIECKDWSRPVDSPQVEAFITKCRDTAISSGVMVARNGFTSAAILKARQHNIKCLNLTEAVTFDWLLTDHFSLFVRHINHIDFQPVPEDESVIGLLMGKSFTMFDSNGAVITDEVIKQLIPQQLFAQEQTPIEEATGEQIIKYFNIALSPPVYLQINDYHERIKCSAATARIKYRVIEERKPLLTFDYSQSDGTGSVAQGVFADFEINGENVRLSLVGKPGDNTQVILSKGKNS